MLRSLPRTTYRNYLNVYILNHANLEIKRSSFLQIFLLEEKLKRPKTAIVHEGLRQFESNGSLQAPHSFISDTPLAGEGFDHHRGTSHNPPRLLYGNAGLAADNPRIEENSTNIGLVTVQIKSCYSLITQ